MYRLHIFQFSRNVHRTLGELTQANQYGMSIGWRTCRKGDPCYQEISRPSDHCSARFVAGSFGPSICPERSHRSRRGWPAKARDRSRTRKDNQHGRSGRSYYLWLLRAVGDSDSAPGRIYKQVHARKWHAAGSHARNIARLEFASQCAWRWPSVRPDARRRRKQTGSVCSLQQRNRSNLERSANAVRSFGGA